MGRQHTLTELIHRAERGDAAAADSLFAHTYDDLRRLARARLRATSRSATLDTTALVHESYLRFAGSGRLRLEDRVHFMRWAGRVMRSVIVDYARHRRAARRGGSAVHLPVTTQMQAGIPAGEDEILRVNEALDELASVSPRLADVVEMRYFGGMSEAEIAEALGVTDRTVRRDWEKARLLLRETLA